MREIEDVHKRLSKKTNEVNDMYRRIAELEQDETGPLRLYELKREVKVLVEEELKLIKRFRELSNDLKESQ